MGNTIWKKHKLLMIAMAVSIVLIFMMEPLYGNVGDASGLHQVNSQSTNGSVGIVSPYASSSSTPWTYPTNTTQEPGYTGGNYTLGQIGNPNYFNAWEANTVCDFFVLDEIYNTATDQFPNGTVAPCLATSWNEVTAPHGLTTYDPMTGQTVPVRFVWTVHIRPNVQWDDFSQAKASDTYDYSNHVSFNNSTGVHFTHTYSSVYNATSKSNQTWPSVIKMKTYYVQAADFILSWEILSSSTDFSTSYSGVVNVVPLNNLTVEYYLSTPSATFVPYTLDTEILPYHIWVNHDYASSGSGLWNESSTLPSSGAYNSWDLGHVSGTGEYPGLVGTGPFMMNGGYGLPIGKYFKNDYWKIYENPNYFVQYFSGAYKWMRQFVPKIYSVKTYIYSSPSAAVGALSIGQINGIMNGNVITSEFLGTLNLIPHINIYEKPSTGYAYFKFNSYSADAPYNITAFRQALRYASPLSYIDSSICDGFNVPGYSILPAVDAPYYDGSVPQYSYDPAKANATIASIPGMSFKGGEWYYRGTQVTATIQSPSASLIPQIFTGYEKIASDWSAIGIHTVVLSESFSTIVAKLLAYSNSAASPSASYNVITLGVSGLFGDPVGDLIGDFNYTVALGTGDYQGPYSTMNVSTPYSSALGALDPSKVLSGSQIDSLMANLSTFANENSSLLLTHYAIDAMQYIEDEESTMMPIGYGPRDIMAYTNATFSGVSHVVSDLDGFWAQNLFSVHLRSHPVSSVKVTGHVVVTAHTSKLVYFNGEYGNITFYAVNNLTDKPMVGSTIVVGNVPSLVNISSFTGTLNSAGEYKYEFRVASTNEFTNTLGYNGLVNVSATVVSNVAGVSSGSGYLLLNDLPAPVAYSVSGPSTLVNNSGYSYYNVTVYNPVTKQPISGYSYIIQTMTAAIRMKTTSTAQLLQYLSNYNSAYGVTSLSVPVNKTYSSANVTSISGVTGSNGLISVMVSVNQSFNFTLNHNYTSYIFMGDYALAAPMPGEAPYNLLGQVTSAENPNGYGTGEPFEIPITILQRSSGVVNISITKKGINSTTTELVFSVTSGGHPVPSYSLNITSQNALGANRGYFMGYNKSAIDPNFYLVQTAGPDTGSQYLPMANLKTNANGLAYVNFTSLFYSYNATTGAISPMSAPSGAYLPFDEFEISATGDGAFGAAQATVVSNGSSLYVVTFSETGLKSGTVWTVDLAYLSGTSSNGTITFEVVNGSYSYTVQNVTFYAIVENATGKVTVNGADKFVQVRFLYIAHNVTFTETGLKNGTSWQVTLNGVTENSTSSTITFVELNGTYSYRVGNVTGYNITKNGTGSVVVHGNNVAISVQFSPVVKPSVVTPTNYTEYYIIGGVIAAIVVVAGVVMFLSKKRKT
ncbi:MAG: ABC transporter substrate-binding protein [Candidatus Thermoplasmatota archaeon]|nr:ABC transporter substrate-binding protein [Candidatus Thermoplasmatota archaeon]